MNLNHSQKIFRKFGIRMANYYSTSLTSETLNTFEHLQFISKLGATNSKASIVECGFGVGKSFSALAYLAGKSGRDLYGFDTFEGFPEPGPIDSSSRNAKKAMEFSYTTRGKEAN